MNSRFPVAVEIESAPNHPYPRHLERQRAYRNSAVFQRRSAIVDLMFFRQGIPLPLQYQPCHRRRNFDDSLGLKELLKWCGPPLLDPLPFWLLFQEIPPRGRFVHPVE